MTTELARPPITDSTVLDCGHTPSAHGPHTTGYGTTAEGQTACYACCAARERQSMIDTGRAVLYLTWDETAARYVLTDWPGELRFTAHVHTHGGHNIARTQDHVWFTGPDGKPWYGVQYGDNSQLTYCKRIKAGR